MEGYPEGQTRSNDKVYERSLEIPTSLGAGEEPDGVSRFLPAPRIQDLIFLHKRIIFKYTCFLTQIRFSYRKQIQPGEVGQEGRKRCCSISPWGELGPEHANCDTVLPGVFSRS